MELKNLDFSSDYYEEHRQVGLDYLGHGYWQQSYGKMLAEATLQQTYERPIVFDAGCACGSILAGFRHTGIFDKIVGYDISEHMVKLGREHFGFSDEELRAGTIADTGLPDDSVTLLHSAQVLEHIPPEYIDDILDEFARVMAYGGRAFLCLDAIRNGEDKEIYMGDPTHFNIQPVNYWTEKLHARGLLFDVEAYNRFVRNEHGPTEGDQRNFYEHYPYWTAWTLIKL